LANFYWNISYKLHTISEPLLSPTCVCLMCCSLVVLLLFIPPSAKALASDQLPLSRLAPARVQPGLCTLTYRISTQSPECQKLYDQGLGYFYSYVWHEAARSFETAVRHDPECAMAWLGLSRALSQWSSRSGKAMDALKKAYELRERASYAEKQMIEARATEKGVAKNAPAVDGNARKNAAQKIFDELLMVHPEDEEAWMMRGLFAADDKFFGGNTASTPYYLYVIKLNPLHPGANHELLHRYEYSQRPSLGWLYSVRYIESTPGIPHSWHMQGHLATRLGRWDNAADQALKSVALQRKHNQEWKLKGSEDHQWSHHLETCLDILTHQGRYREARQIYDEMLSLKFNTPEAFARFLYQSHDEAGLQKWIDEAKGKQKNTAHYFAALALLRKGEASKAKADIEALEEALKKNTGDKKLQSRVWETRGLSHCKSGLADEGLEMLKKAAVAAQKDYQQHAWGHGAYYMEVWGQAALAAGKEAVAEEAFLEALAHDPGSFHGALGLQVLCERTNRADEAKQYQAMAEKAWQHAEVKVYHAAVNYVRQLKPVATLSTSAGS
jgi:pentatricopeptide repeat protein